MPKAYLDRLGDLIPGHPVLTASADKNAMGRRCSPRAADEFGETQHVLSLANPPPELIGPPERRLNWCGWRTTSSRICAGNIPIISRRSSRPAMNNVEASVKEADRGGQGA